VSLPLSCHLYVGGSEVTYQLQTAGGSPTNNATNELRIGNRGDETRTFDGEISNLAIWNTELSYFEVNLLSKANITYLPLQIRQSNLNAYFPLNDLAELVSPTTTTIMDISPFQTHIGITSSTTILGMAEEVLSYP